ncbi:aromatic ring-hydroxylating dioxygenase subunit alpha [Streptomyces sp. NBC_01242]|uniref:aromatic ring-hydroxylating oxygenase subunit alpha n=1 Tax=unclassified Streptomyces TaxID=2593676 RepID=UPI0022521310|nr:MULTISPECIES: aromatic ring-hydroxylating dioxygenase subunit alpha [unclassified Streptomyces]MCX4796801.1 aromatic ring-hydroxylating dioxygenase subunit alpha [Streptomyces sp. NBC_01242]WSJ38019.1 aromatic ring-hydroxylating dioxygenase subunit alpha [Streptomyces sp. NBC_01321]WSP55715.1 aromatic ring-hydroxylating dioxygenase subunit alpha [Streptomyces sp. NBC_01241]WSU23549.1 aromatic ring-hydroxylating dioxygenase subunit alpha [Streptomyces sp. NBC_01108]
MSTSPRTTDTPMTKREQAERAMRHSWFPVARSVDLETPEPAVLLGEQLVVFRDADGVARVTARRCPHRGADLSQGKVTGGSIGCPYHGWRFDGAEGGCTYVPSLPDQSKIPPKAAIRTYPAVERFGHVWTVLEEPVTELYDPEEWRGHDLVWLAANPLNSPTGVAAAIENFRDVAHFPFVHQVSMGPTPEVVEPLQVRRDGIDVHMERPLDAGNGDWANQGDCMMSYHCTAPGFASISYHYEQAGLRVVAGFPSPVGYEQVKIFWGVANDRDFKGDSLEECLRIEEMVYLEDMPVVENLSPREVPWDAEVPEFSVPADLFTINYRRAFVELMNRTAKQADAAGGTPS